MAAIEVASTEGFTRSTQDVSLRRLATFSLSPALKAAFEQIYGPPYLARMLFAELGREGEPNLFTRLDFDGTMHTSGGPHLRSFEEYGVLAGTALQAAAMERRLAGVKNAEMTLEEALGVALDAWTVGHLSREDGRDAHAEAIEAAKKEHLAEAVLEVAVLERERAAGGDLPGVAAGGSGEGAGVERAVESTWSVPRYFQLVNRLFFSVLTSHCLRLFFPTEPAQDNCLGHPCIRTRMTGILRIALYPEILRHLHQTDRPQWRMDQLVLGRRRAGRGWGLA